MFTRREFLQTASISTASVLSTNMAMGADNPSDRITVGIIGLGSRAFNLINSLLAESDAQIVALCDVDEFHHRDLPWGQGSAFGRKPAQKKVSERYAKKKKSGTVSHIDLYSDFREVCQRDDIDAVIVATPDHWHAAITLYALKNGKDVYCEKPVTHRFREGQLVYREVEKQNAIFQTGSQQRSGKEFHQAVELVRNGHLGTIKGIEVGLPPGYSAPMGDTTAIKPPETLDYDFWCGPSEKLPYMRARHHRWWRGHSAYGGGVLMDWIGHHNDIAQWAIGFERSGPISVEAVGWTFPQDTTYDTPHQYEIKCQYPGNVSITISSKYKNGVRIVGTSGSLYVNRGKIEASDPRILKPGFKRGSKTVYASPGHMRNFLDGIKSRKECIAPAEIAHRSITPGHLGYVSHALGRKLAWDAKQEIVVDDAEANKLLNQLQYRAPWMIDS
ncbi:MAG: dehydrogenase [Blastopirellula sp.]|nr:MAG: dehydrogenase [Blastopirellula sp.]